MKKKVRLGLGVLVFAIVTLLGYKVVTKLNYKKEVAERIKIIPNFSFFDLKGKKFTETNLKNEPTVFIYFNSDCDYCQSEATKIQERLSEFRDVQLIFVSFESKEGIKKFAKIYNLDNKDNIVFLEDKEGEFSKIFDAHSIPYILVYGKNQRLLKKFKGITKINDVLKVLE